MNTAKTIYMSIETKHEAVLEDQNRCCLCGTDLKFQHKVDYMTLKIEEKSNCQNRKFETLVALHNNTDDDVHGELLSILTEKKLIDVDNRYVNINPQWDIDNFFIATLKSTYDRIVQAANPNMSLILERPRDIGYLSNWAINKNIDFITIEAQQSDAVSNRRKIELVQSLYRESR